MRTRRSPRNQERLWRELGGATAARAITQVTLEERLARLEAAAADPFTSPRDKRHYRREADRIRARIAAVRAAKEEA